MEDDVIKNAMAKRLVYTMEPETAKAVLLKVINGDDIYAAILDESDPDNDKPTLPKRRYRKTKKATNFSPTVGSAIV